MRTTAMCTGVRGPMLEIRNIVGLIGVGLILMAYLLLQIEKLKSEDLTYSLLNLAGAACILISLTFEWNLPSFVVETFWLGISVYGIVKFFRKRLRG